MAINHRQNVRSALIIRRNISFLTLALAAFFHQIPLAAQDPTNAIAERTTPSASQTTVAFVDVNVVTMVSERILHQQTVVVCDGLIECVGDRDLVRIPNNALTIQGNGRYLMPGLCDMHAHLRKKDDTSILTRYLRAGVTCVREMNGRPDMLGWRKKIKAGKLLGPDLVIACPTIGNWSSPKLGYPTPQTKTEGRSVVRKFAGQGFDWIKFYTFVPREGFEGIVDEAQRQGMPLAGHIPLEIPLAEALQSGITSIEHLTGYLDSCMTPEAKEKDEKDLRSVFHAGEIDEKKLDAAVEKTVLSRVWNCPTIVFFDRCLPTSMVEAAWSRPQLRQQGYDNRRYIVKKLHEAGARLVVGTDSDGDVSRLPASVIVDEMLAMKEAGMPIWAVLRAATVNAAEMLDQQEVFGTVTPGMRANLILLKNNPSENLKHLRQLDMVMVGGRLMKLRED